MKKLNEEVQSTMNSSSDDFDTKVKMVREIRVLSRLTLSPHPWIHRVKLGLVIKECQSLNYLGSEEEKVIILVMLDSIQRTIQLNPYSS